MYFENCNKKQKKLTLYQLDFCFFQTALKLTAVFPKFAAEDFPTVGETMLMTSSLTNQDNASAGGSQTAFPTNNNKQKWRIVETKSQQPMAWNTTGLMNWLGGSYNNKKKTRVKKFVEEMKNIAEHPSKKNTTT